MRHPWEAEEGETSDDDEILETEDDFAPDGETTGGKAQKEGEFKMKIIDIEDADESDEDEGEDEGDSGGSAPPVSAGRAGTLVIEEVGDVDVDGNEALAAPAPAPAVARVQIEEDDDSSEEEEDPDDLDELD